jgi:hypothetical protein
MRQSITTKYIGPSNVRGSRIKATARKRSNLGGEMSLTVPYQYEGTEQEHCKAAKALARKLDWSGLWVGGGNVDENGYVFVNVAAHYEGAPTDSIGMEDQDWFFIERATA